MRLIDADALEKEGWSLHRTIRVDKNTSEYHTKPLIQVPTIDAVPVVRCNDCIYGYLYMDVQNGVTDSWIECRNPEGLNRDVSVDGYCSASIRRM